jgi:type IV secretory pathway VirB4 component
VRYVALDKQDGQSLLRDYQDKWEQLVWEGWNIVGKIFPSDAQDQADSLAPTLVSLHDDRVAVGYLTPIVTVWGDTRDELAARERGTVKVLQQQGLLVMPEVVNAALAWLGALPGDVYHGLREPPLPSLALAFLLPHASI